MTAQRLHTGDGVRDEIGTWEIRYMGADYIFMVGMQDRATADDQVTMTRVVRRQLFDNFDWEKGPFDHAGREGGGMAEG